MLSNITLTYPTLFIQGTYVMSSPYNYTKKKFWKPNKILTGFADSLRGMDSSFSSFGVQQTLFFLHWKIAGLQDTVDLLKSWVSSTLAKTCLIITTDNGILTILQNYEKRRWSIVWRNKKVSSQQPGAVRRHQSVGQGQAGRSISGKDHSSSC